MSFKFPVFTATHLTQVECQVASANTELQRPGSANPDTETEDILTKLNRIVRAMSFPRVHSMYYIET